MNVLYYFNYVMLTDSWIFCVARKDMTSGKFPASHFMFKIAY